MLVSYYNTIGAKCITVNHHLEQIAQAIFKSWFVDFEPFAKGDFIDSVLGEIPVGWRVVKLSDVATFESGYSYKSTELQKSRIAMATIKNFDRKCGFKIDGFKEIAISGKIKPTQYAKLYDVLVAHTDVTQNADIIGNAELLLSFGGYDKVIISLDLVNVRSKNIDLSSFVLASILRSSSFKTHALGFVNGTTVLHLSKKALPEYMFALPIDTSILNSLNRLIEPIYIKIADNMRENDKLKNLRDILLPKLMSGELSISDFDNAK